jgi:hypothetical protein
MTHTRHTTPTDPAQASIFDRGDRPRSRTSDPETSKQAAASITAQRASHRRVLAMFTNYGDMTDERLGELLDAAAKETGFKSMSPSGVRSRRSELSKPNMDRLDQIASDLSNDGNTLADIHPEQQEHARSALRIEGFRSPLWDTGKREKLSTGRLGIVWGVAR